MALDVFGWLVVGVIGFITIRIIYEAFVQTMKGHTEPPETCKRCRQIEEQGEFPNRDWCDCPRRESFDHHCDEPSCEKCDGEQK